MSKRTGFMNVGESRDAVDGQLGSNLKFLLKERFAFIDRYLGDQSRVLEIGAGIGSAKYILENVNLVRTDATIHASIDVAADAQLLPFETGIFDAVVAVAVLHHLDHPRKALDEIGRVLKSGGVVLIVESHNSWLLRGLLAISGNEYVDDNVDPFGPGSCKRDSDQWDGNNAIGDLLFSDKKRFEANFPDFTVIHHKYKECVIFANSGGVYHKAPYIPLPELILKPISLIDRALSKAAPGIFPLVQEVVLRRS